MARRFIAHQSERVLWAENDVRIQEGASLSTVSDEAKYVDKDQAVYLWGTKQTVIDWQDPQGSGHFLSDRAAMYLSPRRLRLEDHVKGHVVPQTL
jgi:lipopolysaccharide assembly outer membrane protein LptD (OstA)